MSNLLVTLFPGAQDAIHKYLLNIRSEEKIEGEKENYHPRSLPSSKDPHPGAGDPQMGG